MRTRLVPLCLLVACCGPIKCGESRGAEPAEIPLWPDKMPGPAVPAHPPEKVEVGADGISRRSNVSKPRLFVYAPKDGAKSGTAIVVVPGGGFGKLADGHEGSDACRWLAGQGITAFLLVHRTPTTKHDDPAAGPVMDCQKAVAEVRGRAEEFGIDPKKVGVLGFSAGGQVALVAATNDLRFPAEGKIASHRPDFLMLLYPWKIYDPERKALRADIRPEAGLPPTFIAQMGDDAGSLAQGSALLYLELINRKVPAEIHVYERGGHGFGMNPRPNAPGPGDWPRRAEDWLRQRGLTAEKK